MMMPHVKHLCKRMKQDAGCVVIRVTRWVIAGVLVSACSHVEVKQPAEITYLFAYFLGNGPGQEMVHYALSWDGYNYRTLNNNKPVLRSEQISSSGGVRDPHILLAADGKTFYMVVTDLYVPEQGWSNRAMVMLKSDDLIHWSSSVVDIPDTFPEQFRDVNRVWAPQTIYDPDSERYMLYWSMRSGDGPDIIYYAYANEDFTGLATTPKQLYFSPTNGSAIDGDIVFHDGQYHLFLKTEDKGKGIKKAVADRLTGEYRLYDRYLNQTDKPVEGSAVFKLADSDKYIMMYDVYMDGQYQFTESEDLVNFSIVDESISMDFHPRHGSVLPITSAEAERLQQQWGAVEAKLLASESAAVKQANVVIDAEENTVYLPVKPGGNISELDPEFKLADGHKIRPAGPQDFSKGAVTYTLYRNGQPDGSYQVSAAVDGNPVLEGYYADPEIFFSERDQRYYLYPTSDGHYGWSGTYFEVFSSPDLIHWENEGVILDLERDVSWADRNAWAPSAIEQMVDGQYRYFYYFTAAQKIGVAVADNPEGPYTDSGQPLINFKPEGVTGGQEIDPDVFLDPVSGKSYLYWGNGYLAVAELNEDMVSIDRETIQVLTPDATFREGVEVFYRDGTYYFLWSENDTRSEDYRVRYATAESPVGPLRIPDDNLVLAKDPAKGIYGTGHNSVVKVPGKDCWYIVYHRFNRPNGIAMGRAAGFHREVSIDPLLFDGQGMIKPTPPTLQGLASEDSATHFCEGSPHYATH
jgi:arabinoxylan arabinofuranohydrolase